MRRGVSEGLRQALFACAAAAVSAAAVTSGTAVAASLDEDKLRLLSCDTSATGAGRHRAVQWLNQSAQALPGDAGQRLAGPVRLGKACLANVSIAGSFGVMFIQGEICNADLDEFTEALAAAGTRLGKDVEATVPGTMLGKVSAERQYLITRGMVDMRTGKAVPTSAPYAFSCAARAGGPQ